MKFSSPSLSDGETIIGGRLFGLRVWFLVHNLFIEWTTAPISETGGGRELEPPHLAMGST